MLYATAGDKHKLPIQQYVYVYYSYNICIHIYIYIYIYICVYIYIYICICIYIYIHMYRRMHLIRFQFMCTSMYIYIYIYIHTYTYMYMLDIINHIFSHILSAIFPGVQRSGSSCWASRTMSGCTSPIVTSRRRISSIWGQAWNQFENPKVQTMASNFHDL